MTVRTALFALSLLGAGAALTPAPAKAASFDCTKARAADEVAVCTSTQLSELDATLGAYWFAYSKVPMMMGSNGARLDEAQAFLKTRSACGSNKDCLTNAYRLRISYLKASITAAMVDVFRQENRDPCPAPAG